MECPLMVGHIFTERDQSFAIEFSYVVENNIVLELLQMRF